MNQIIPLMRREWLQHRNGWLLLMGIPFGLLLLASTFGTIQFNKVDDAPISNSALPMVVTLVAILGVTVVNFLIVWITSLFIATGTSRRDQGDRSIEFWLSLPTSHAASLTAPLLVHLLLVPAAALVLGMLGGTVVSAVLTTRLEGFGAWLSLPWVEIGLASMATLARLLVGLPLATLWLLPLILLALLAEAWIGRWGVPVVGLALILGGVLLERLLGQPLLSQALHALWTHAATAMLPFDSVQFDGDNFYDAASRVASLSGWVWSRFGVSLRELASPLML
ncbi:MAG: hypothetical protein ABIN96_02960, partial [Rubrivivax sp.]